MTTPQHLHDMALRLKTLLRNGKETPFVDNEEERYYTLVVSKFLDPNAPPRPPGSWVRDIQWDSDPQRNAQIAEDFMPLPATPKESP